MSTFINLYSSSPLSKLSLKYGGYTAVALVAFFLIMKLVGLAETLELRFLNFFILAGGVTYAVRNYRNNIKKEGEIDYLEGFGIGFFTACVAGLIFGAFLYLYLKFIDPGFLHYIQLREPMGVNVTPLTAVGAIMFEAVGSGCVLALVALQYYRRPKVLHHHEEEHSTGVHHWA